MPASDSLDTPSKPIIIVIPYDVTQLDWSSTFVQSLQATNQLPTTGFK